jgi:hypothetical protein
MARKILGYIILSLPFDVIFGLMCKFLGWKPVVLIFAGVAGILITTFVGIHLVDPR